MRQKFSPTGRENHSKKKYSPLGKWEILQTNMQKVWRRRLDIWCVSRILNQVIAATGPGKRRISGAADHRQLAEVIAEEQFLASSMGGSSLIIVSGQNAELKWQVVSPVICAGDATGSVVILAKDGRKKPGELEQKMALCTLGFLGRQMEQ